MMANSIWPDGNVLQKAGVIFLAVWYALLSTHLIALLVPVHGQPTLITVSTSNEAVSDAGTSSGNTGDRMPVHKNHSTSEDVLCMFCEMDVVNLTVSSTIPSTDSVSPLHDGSRQLLYRLNLYDQVPPELLLPDSRLKVPISLG